MHTLPKKSIFFNPLLRRELDALGSLKSHRPLSLFGMAACSSPNKNGNGILESHIVKTRTMTRMTISGGLPQLRKIIETRNAPLTRLSTFSVATHTQFHNQGNLKLPFPNLNLEFTPFLKISQFSYVLADQVIVKTRIFHK